MTNNKLAWVKIQDILKDCPPEQKHKIVCNLVIQEIKTSGYPMDVLGKLMMEICVTLYDDMCDVLECDDFPGEPQ